MKKAKSFMFTFFGFEMKFSQKLKLRLYYNDMWHYFIKKMSNFINTKVYIFGLKKYTVKNPKMDSIMDIKMFHSNLQMPAYLC
jgi:hypothetical protein